MQQISGERLQDHWSSGYFFIFQNLLKRACYSSIMDIPPVLGNQPTSFKFPQRSFGKANPVNMSFQASSCVFDQDMPSLSYKINSASGAKIVPKCIKIVSTDVQKYKIFSGEIPRIPLTRGVIPPLVLSPHSYLRHS